MLIVTGCSAGGFSVFRFQLLLYQPYSQRQRAVESETDVEEDTDKDHGESHGHDARVNESIDSHYDCKEDKGDGYLDIPVQEPFGPVTGSLRFLSVLLN